MSEPDQSHGSDHAFQVEVVFAVGVGEQCRVEAEFLSDPVLCVLDVGGDPLLPVVVGLVIEPSYQVIMGAAVVLEGDAVFFHLAHLLPAQEAVQVLIDGVCADKNGQGVGVADDARVCLVVSRYVGVIDRKRNAPLG